MPLSRNGPPSSWPRLNTRRRLVVSPPPPPRARTHTQHNRTQTRTNRATGRRLASWPRPSTRRRP
eukprot:10248841-Alexandrium_andersonii.AAC.1